MVLMISFMKVKEHMMKRVRSERTLIFIGLSSDPGPEAKYKLTIKAFLVASFS
jgi:hypothetical protein